MKQSITMNLKMAEIIFDIQNKTYLTGRSLSPGISPAHIANMQANSDEENESQVLRSITTAVSKLRNYMSEYLDEAEDTCNNECYKSGDNISLTLNMPANFNGAVVKVLAQAAHDYIVNKSIHDWFGITAKGETIDYDVKAVESLKVIEEALNKRVRPTR